MFSVSFLQLFTGQKKQPVIVPMYAASLVSLFLPTSGLTAPLLTLKFVCKYLLLNKSDMSKIAMNHNQSHYFCNLSFKFNFVGQEEGPADVVSLALRCPVGPDD